MKMYIDLSGQIQQINLDSSLGFWREDGLNKAVFLKKSTKKEIIKKYKGQVTNLIEKLHCIMIYFCILDYLKDVNELEICKDVNFRRIKNLLPLLFKERDFLHNIKISQRKSNTKKSFGHRIALKIFRKKKYADKKITKEMIEYVLFKFKKE